MVKKQTKSKKAAKSRKAPKADAAVPAAWPESKPPKERARDPRLPPVGSTIVRPYKGREIRVKMLEDGFGCEGAVFKSLSALAAKITEAGAINGYLFFRLTGPKAAAPKPETARETPAAPAKARTAKGAKVRRAGRDPVPAAPSDAVAETAPEAATA